MASSLRAGIRRGRISYSQTDIDKPKAIGAIPAINVIAHQLIQFLSLILLQPTHLHNGLAHLHIFRSTNGAIQEQNVPMDLFGQRLRERAQQLGVSNAEAARRCGLDERRYGHYVSGRTEPDLATLVKIAQTLGTTPNWLLGISSEEGPATPRSDYLDRLGFVAKALPDHELGLLVTLAEALARHTDAKPE